MAINPTKSMERELKRLLIKKNTFLELVIKYYEYVVVLQIQDPRGSMYVKTSLPRKEWDAINMYPQTHFHYLPIIAGELQLL